MPTGLLMTVTVLISDMKQEHKRKVVVLYPKAMLRRVLTGNQIIYAQIFRFYRNKPKTASLPNSLLLTHFCLGMIRSAHLSPFS